MQGGHGLSDHGDPRGVAWRMLSPFEISNAVYKHCFYIFLTPPSTQSVQRTNSPLSSATFRLTPLPRSFVSGVNQLPPGSLRAMLPVKQN